MTPVPPQRETWPSPQSQLARTASTTASRVIVGCDSRSSSGPAPTAPTVESAPVLGPAPPGGLHAHSPAAHAHGAAAGGSGVVEPKMRPEINQQLSEIRAFTAQFHNFDKAVEYEYSIPAPGPGICISDPVRGGIGYHYTYAHKNLITDGEVNLLEPEFLVYAPKKNGGVKFSALDYFVPYDTWPHEDPPSLLGIPFAREDGFGAYVLHIWLYWHNPAGMFENFNPDVPLC